MQKMGCYLQGQGHSNWVWVHTMKWLSIMLNCWSFCDQLSLTVHVHKLDCLVKRLCLQSRSQWRLGTAVNVCPDNISDRINLIWWCIIMSQSIIQKYLCAIFKVQATIIFTIYIFTSTCFIIHHHFIIKRFCWFYSGCQTQNVAWVTVDQIVDTLGHSAISSRGQYWFQSRKCGQNIAVMNIYTCLLNLLVNVSSVWLLDPFVLVMVST